MKVQQIGLIKFINQIKIGKGAVFQNLKNQKEKSIFQLNYARYDKTLIKNFLLEKVLKICIHTFFDKMYI